MILIRADANETIGVGHIMRCLPIACAFTAKGEDVLFVTADHKGDGLISDFRSVCMETKWTDMEEETDILSSIVAKYKPFLLLIDSYYVTKQYFAVMSDIVCTAYIDDMNLSCWNVDFLINYNIYASNFNYKWYEGTKTRLLLSPKYIPLRDEFVNLPKHEIKDVVTDVLVSAGGADPEAITEKLVQELCPSWPNIYFHFIIGALNPRLQRIKNLKERNIIIHINEQHMSDLMQKCDIAVSAAGMTLYELCAVGIPTIMYTLADNQIDAAEYFFKQRIMLKIGDCRGNEQFIFYVNQSLKELINNKKKRKVLSRKMQSLVDDKGAERIVDELLMQKDAK